ncbi:hypothetical protein ASC77_00410 [Nocardioides sp. Root1257]|nr:hypothetical protein ASC77_00410 [Nocardioides sp. Root1257]KRC55507.1 hypothetical protein ASE24_00410 [Nocardioides sp. Root224]
MDLCSLEPGTHLCAFPTDEQQSAQIATTFVERALSDGDRLLYVASDEQAQAMLRSLPPHLDAAAALAAGQLQVRSFAEAYGRGPTDLGAVADGFRAAAAQTRKDGFPGLRVAAHMDELAALLGSVEETVRWERLSTDLQREIGVSSVCLYRADRLSGDAGASLAGEHAGASPERAERSLAQFLAVDEPWGLRVSGEVDLSNRDQLRRAVLSRAGVVPRLHLDLRALTFTDVGSLSALRATAASLPADGWLLLDGASNAVRRTLEICDLGHERMRVQP